MKGELYRLNMPFELGLDVGCQRFAGGLRKRKKCLILDAESYRYQPFRTLRALISRIIETSRGKSWYECAIGSAARLSCMRTVQRRSGTASTTSQTPLPWRSEKTGF